MTESLPGNDVIVAKNVRESAYPPAAPVDPQTDRKANRKKKKKSGAFGLFKAALFMLRKSRGDKSGAKINLTPKQDGGEAENNPNPNWTKLVDSVRPMHVQETAQSPPPSPSPGSPAHEEIRDIIPSASPACSYSSSSSSRVMSKYGSAASLLDLDNSSDEEDEDPDEVFDALTGDEMIDAKAEEFIAQFYKQMHIQRAAKTHHHHHYHGHNLSRGI